MTKEEFKRIRLSLSLTQRELAAYLGFKSFQAVQRIEAGKSSITGPVAVLMAHLRDSEGMARTAKPVEWVFWKKLIKKA